MRARTRSISPIPWRTGNPTSPSAAPMGRRKSRSCRRTSTVGSTPREIVHVYDGKRRATTINEVFLADNQTNPNRFRKQPKTKPDGTLDATFGDQGRVILPDTKTSEVQAIVTATSLYIYTDNGFLTNPASASLTRYSPDGIKDTSFGTNGTVSVATFISGFAEQADGKLVYVAPIRNDSATRNSRPMARRTWLRLGRRDRAAQSKPGYSAAAARQRAARRCESG